MENVNASSFPITPSTVRYIKLGVGNQWFESCKRNNRLEFGHHDVPHAVAMMGDRKAIAKIYVDMGRTPGKGADYARAVFDFYHLDESCLWITFAEGSLWWAFAKRDVVMLEPDGNHGVRCRDLVTSWSNLDVNGNVLSQSSLSTRLTKVAAYRQTLCGVGDAEAYLVNRINGVVEPFVAEAQAVQSSLIRVTEQLIAQLHWRDFEIVCDLIFARSGWQRTSELGGLQKDTDLVLEQSATGERAFVQVKSSSDQATLDRYVAEFEADPSFDRMFFVCHTSKVELVVRSSVKPTHVWAGQTTARQAIAAGLIDWLMKKAA